jgi:hypothetical protein
LTVVELMRSVVELMRWVEASAVAKFVSETAFGFSILDMVHVAAISVVVGMIGVLDLRLIGVAFKDSAITDLSRQVLPWTWGAFAFAVATGVLMFMGQAARYAVNFAFLVKLGLMAVAGLNVLIFHFITYRNVAKWDNASRPPAAAMIAGALSLVCWVAVVFYGRFTAYYMFP